MTTYEAGDITLHKLRDFVWEIPKEGDMRVPARVLASETLLDQISDDLTLTQLKNATHLPGIQNHAICMPDGHQGYGFPVGGVAGIDTQDGCISPGAVGYDINCLTGDTEVLLSHGRRMRIDELESRFEHEQAMVAGDVIEESEIQLFTTSGETPVFAVETATGDRIKATADHPFLTPDGMVTLADLEVGDSVYSHPFEGVQHADPVEETILTVEDFERENPQLQRVLKERDVLPLKTTDEAFHRLLKVLGFHIGDGSFSSGGQTWFYGEPEDLELIREDIQAIGFKPSKIYERDRTHEINGQTFSRTEYSFKATSKAFQKLLIALGAPTGRKIESGFTTPPFLSRLPAWQKALFYGAYFGAEMSKPSAHHDKNLYCPKVSQTRTPKTAGAGRQFFEDMATFLGEVGIETNEIEEFETDSNRDLETVRLRLGVKNDSKDLIQFFSTIGYRYNLEKQRAAILATQYLKTKEREIERRETIETEARALADGGMQVSKIKNAFDINGRFIERSIWSGRKSRPRPGDQFPGFTEYCDSTHINENLTVETEIVSITPLEQNEPVYDIGVSHEAHNFIVNGLVVSNCGVRMMTTNLTYDDLKGHEEELVEALFDAIPSGLGGGGVVQDSVATVNEVLDKGMRWALDQGYATEADLAHCEDEGFRPDARPDKVSEKAKNRGRNQLGSLGSGNHFLEVQRVTDVFREDVGDAFGLEEDQIVVLIHCGSRGLGHQVCTDYLRKIEKQHGDLLTALPDRELAAAPAGSQLAEDYYGAMCAAINFAWVNRQLIMHRTREVFAEVFDRPWEEMDMTLLYDVAHNIAKKEVHEVAGEQRELFVHRKGATRAFPAGRPELPPAYRDVGQPIIIPGSMGTHSYILRGGENSLGLTFGSTAHGAGRVMSRTQAKQEFWGETVQEELREHQHIYVKAQSGATVAEEAPGVYKDIDEVIRVSDALGIGDKVARTLPVCNIKG